LRLHRRLLATCCEPEQHPARGDWQKRIVQLLEEGVQPCHPQRTLDLGDGVEMVFSFIPPGTFLMGRPEEEEGDQDELPQRRVTLTKGFFLAVHPVTQAQWHSVLGNNPSRLTGDNLPVEQVSWEDCQEFCQRLAVGQGRSCRLPTEAEWEYACRAGTTTPFSFGESISTDQANYDGSSPTGRGNKGQYRKKTTPVGSFPPNAWGLYDMHGNVWEWCLDCCGPYSPGNQEDPVDLESGIGRVLRGGSWFSTPRSCRSACRGWNQPGLSDILFGCRVVLCLE
jgi:formylglycine-generating enzyme required for sulfatase activity